MSFGVQVNGKHCWLLTALETHPAKERLVFFTVEEARHWAMQFSTSAEGTHALRDALYATGLESTISDAQDRRTINQIAHLLFDGTLRVAVEDVPAFALRGHPAGPKSGERKRTRPQTAPAAPALRAPYVPEPTTAPEDKIHWIEIELVGEDDKPIPHEAYICIFPDGKEAQGRLNKAGFARLASIAVPGDCQVSFPNLDAEAWERI